MGTWPVDDLPVRYTSHIHHAFGRHELRSLLVLVRVVNHLFDARLYHHLGNHSDGIVNGGELSKVENTKTYLGPIL